MLEGEQAKNMWKMLLSRNSDIEIRYQILECDQSTGKVDWVATYLFGPKKDRLPIKFMVILNLKTERS
tara:strand:+ start:35359 stop:35562 length:204 start_codon:yes stop_codon:yes gene_type:complete